MSDDLKGWSISCDGAQADSNGRVYALEVLSDGENFASNIHFIEDMDNDNDRIIYEVDEWITTLFLSESGTLYLGDANGRLHHNETGGWKIEDTGCDGALTDIRNFGSTELYLVGNNGFAARRRSPQQYIPLAKGITGTLYAIDGYSAQDLYAVGERGRAVHWNGQDWQSLETGTNLDLHAVLAVSPESIYLCGANGILLHGHHDQWQVIEGWDNDLYALAYYNQRIYLGAGGLGLLTIENNIPVLIKNNIYSYGLAAEGGYLCVSGDNEIVRFDGREWIARSYEL